MPDIQKMMIANRKPKKIPAGKISAEELALRADMSERRLLQLADEGLFPKPERGVYKHIPALEGLLKHYKDLFERKRKMQDALDQETLTTKKRENAEAAGLLVLKAEVAAELQKSLMPIKDTLRAKLENEAPREFSGMDVPQARILGKRLYDEICERFEAIFKKWKI